MKPVKLQRTISLFRFLLGHVIATVHDTVNLAKIEKLFQCFWRESGERRLDWKVVVEQGESWEGTLSSRRISFKRGINIKAHINLIEVVG